jgi:hypothetical protein
MNEGSSSVGDVADEDKRGPSDWELATQIKETHFANIERAVSSTQAFVAILAISGALVGPLVVEDVGAAPSSIIYFTLLAAYLVSLCFSLWNAYGVLVNRPSREKMTPSLIGFTEAAAESVNDFEKKVLALTPDQRVSAMLSIGHRSALVVVTSFQKMRLTIIWSLISLALLAGIVVYKVGLELAWPV